MTFSVSGSEIPSCEFSEERLASVRLNECTAAMIQMRDGKLNIIKKMSEANKGLWWTDKKEKLARIAILIALVVSGTLICNVGIAAVLLSTGLLITFVVPILPVAFSLPLTLFLSFSTGVGIGVGLFLLCRKVVNIFYNINWNIRAHYSRKSMAFEDDLGQEIQNYGSPEINAYSVNNGSYNNAALRTEKLRLERFNDPIFLKHAANIFASQFNSDNLLEMFDFMRNDLTSINVNQRANSIIETSRALSDKKIVVEPVALDLINLISDYV